MCLVPFGCKSMYIHAYMHVGILPQDSLDCCTDVVFLCTYSRMLLWPSGTNIIFVQESAESLDEKLPRVDNMVLNLRSCRHAKCHARLLVE